MDDRRFERRQARPNEKIYISNLSMDTSDDDLRKAFETFGTISDINLKHKDTGIVFAFIEFDSTNGAQRAVQEMNGKTLAGKELKVQFARGNRDRDRGGDRGGDRYRNDRGRGRNDDRRPRDGGDRPKGCFNCGQQGHFARDCTKPRKQRQFDRNRSRGDDRGGYRNRDSRGGYDNRDRDRDRDRHYRKKEQSNSKSRSRSRSNQKKKKQSRKKSDQSY